MVLRVVRVDQQRVGFAVEQVRTAVREDRRQRLAIFSHGGTHLLNGEADTLLIDPYYPKNHRLEASTGEPMRRWYDFLVRYGDLLLDRTRWT